MPDGQLRQAGEEGADLSQPAFARVLADSLAKQADLELPVRVDVVRTGPGAIPTIEVVREWHVNATLDDARVLEFALPEELVAIYTQVGNGFRYNFSEFPRAEELVHAWREVRDADPDDEDDPFASPPGRTLVPVAPGDYYQFFAFTDEGTCEMWRGTDDDPATLEYPSVTQWLDAIVAIHARGLDDAHRWRADTEQRVRALDPASVSTPRDLKRYFEALHELRSSLPSQFAHTFTRYRDEHTAICDPLRIERMRALAEHVSLGALDREVAVHVMENMFNYYTFYPWDVLSTLGARCEYLFSPSDQDSATFYYQLGASYLRQRRFAEALPCLETCTRLGFAVQAANVAYTLLELGRVDEADERLQTLPDELRSQFYALDIRGRIELARGRIDAARESFEAAIADHESKRGSYAQPYLNLAALHLRAGRRDDAKRVLVDRDDAMSVTLGRRSDYYELLAQTLDGDDAAAVRATLAQLTAIDHVASGHRPRTLVLS